MLIISEKLKIIKEEKKKRKEEKMKIVEEEEKLKERQIEETPAPITSEEELQGEQLTFDTTETEEEPNVETVIKEETDVIEETIKTPAPVQTFGQPTCAEPIPEEKPKYNFSTRAGVREFLADYLHWEKGYGFHGILIKDMYWHVLKNKVTVWAIITLNVINATDLESRDKIFYFIDDNKRKAKEISKGDFEKYCEAHKDEL